MADALPPAADRFAYFMECLCRALGDPRFGPLPAGPVILSIWKRLRRIAARFAVLAAGIRAGTLPAPNPGTRSTRKRSVIASCEATKQSPAAAPTQAPRLPNRMGWLTRMRPGLHCFGGLLRHLLNDQEFLSLLAASPGIRKLIRSLCRMFGLPLIPLLREPHHKRTPRPNPELRTPVPNETTSLASAFFTRLAPGQPLPRLHLPPGYDPLVRVPRRKKRT